VTLTVVETWLPAPFALEGVAKYEALAEGAATVTEHAVDEMPPLHEQDVSGVPVPQFTVRVTFVPAVTAAESVFGDWEMLQLDGTGFGGGVPVEPT